MDDQENWDCGELSIRNGNVSIHAFNGVGGPKPGRNILYALQNYSYVLLHFCPHA